MLSATSFFHISPKTLNGDITNSRYWCSSVSPKNLEALQVLVHHPHACWIPQQGHRREQLLQSSSRQAPHFRACCFPHGLLIFWVLRKPAAPPAPAVQALGGAAVGGHMRQQTALSWKVFCLVSWGFVLGGKPLFSPSLARANGGHVA